jgi:hypothetical protein
MRLESGSFSAHWPVTAPRAGEDEFRHEVMSNERLAGSIYDGFSPKGQRALADLRAAFKHAGFYAEKERRTERTLRVYPEKRGKYPLLNPSLSTPGHSTRVTIKRPSVLCPVYSDGDQAIARLLLATPNIEHCRFRPQIRRTGRYYLHGYFILPLFFVGSPRHDVVDFGPLYSPMSELHLHLSSLGFGGARLRQSGSDDE